MNQWLEWQNLRQIRWQGPYEVTKVEPTSFHCKIANFLMQIEGEHIEVAYLAEEGFMVQAEPITSIQMVRQ